MWLYLAPTGGNVGVFSKPIFWVGLAYVVFPINVLVYGVNDYTDVDIDKGNDRKGNFFFGAKCSRAQLKTLPAIITLLTTVPLFCVILPMKTDFGLEPWGEALPKYILWCILAVGVNLA